ncbi:MAG: Gfo/Idh/MocA family oxidoreductase [Gammaproteobacteria bacterium]|nr:Gfo/Idh/MocA family oxidoreductase [Gammaproteobacteria bacterium]
MSSRKDPAPPGRRRFLKGLVGVPALALFGGGIACSRQGRENLMQEADFDTRVPSPPRPGSDPLRVGIIGVGRRGRFLLKHCLTGDLNVAVVGICDVFDVHADEALTLSRQYGHKPRRYRTYHELVAAPGVDAVIIATPDHWHATMALAAAQANKHVYVEKCLGHRLGELIELRRVIKRAPIVLQVGHQHRQTAHFLAARAALRSDLVGHVRIAEVTTRRWAGGGAWQAPVHAQASAHSIDWRQFVGSAPAVSFDAERFFRWRKWWDYGAGLASDALAEDFDRLNGVMHLGIPSAVTASGGVYAHDDGREVPDVLHVGLEFPNHRVASGGQQGMAMVYNAALGADAGRHAALTGHHATLHWDTALTMQSTPAPPWRRDAVLLYAPRHSAAHNAAAAVSDDQITWRHGRLYDASYLHLREWIDCVRHGGTPSCGIDAGFEEAVTIHMATLAYRLNRRVEWDHQALKLRNVTRQELESLRLS